MILLRSLLDIIYPPRCLLCGTFLAGEPLEMEDRRLLICLGCLEGFSRIGSPLCPLCGRPFVRGWAGDHHCEDCLRKKPVYESATAPFLYEGAVMKAIQSFKYGKRPMFADLLGPLLAAHAAERFGAHRGLLTMPVPLHPKRLRERGFNQSLLLARHVTKALGAELDFLSLRRTRYTPPQTGLGKGERLRNVKGAFQVTHPEAVQDRSILLVDDVFTTGNTLNACADVLKKNGSKEVFCLVLARAARL